MEIHDKDINLSIDLNVIGTANLVKACNKKNVKIIFLSTSYIYPGKKVIIKRKMLCCLGIIMGGLNLEQNPLSKCTKTL